MSLNQTERGVVAARRGFESTKVVSGFYAAIATEHCDGTRSCVLTNRYGVENLCPVGSQMTANASSRGELRRGRASDVFGRSETSFRIASHSDEWLRR